MTNTMISVGTVRVLPRPAAAVMSLTDALASRRSVRDYAETPVTDEKLAYILWAAPELPPKTAAERCRPRCIRRRSILM